MPPSTPKPRVSIIMAVARNGVIGRDNDLPWRLPNDLKRFKRLTAGHPMIMGRGTWESDEGFPLPNRPHIVVTSRQIDTKGSERVHVVRTIDRALSLAATLDPDEVFVIGGAGIAEAALDRADRLVLTAVHADVEGDTVVRMPGVNAPADGWTETEREDHPADERHDHPFSFVTLVRSAS